MERNNPSSGFPRPGEPNVAIAEAQATPADDEFVSADLTNSAREAGPTPKYPTDSELDPLRWVHPYQPAPPRSDGEKTVKRLSYLLIMSIILSIPTIARAQIAGSTVVGVAAAELREVALGWSVKPQVLGQAVFNDNGQRIGRIDDIVISPDKAVSYAIINAGGFLGIAKHDGAIPVGQLKVVSGRFVLAGATKEALKASPPFEYATP